MSDRGGLARRGGTPGAGRGVGALPRQTVNANESPCTDAAPNKSGAVPPYGALGRQPEPVRRRSDEMDRAANLADNQCGITLSARGTSVAWPEVRSVRVVLW